MGIAIKQPSYTPENCGWLAAGRVNARNRVFLEIYNKLYFTEV